MRAIMAFWFATVLFAQHANAKGLEILSRSIVLGEWARQDCGGILSADDAIEQAETDTIEGNFKLVIVPCVQGAYNTSSIVFQVDQRTPDDARLLQVMDWSHDDNRWKKAILLFNVRYEEQTKLLITQEIYRGKGDCGSSGHYAWAGADFGLIGYWLKPKCDGIPFKPGGSQWRISLPR
jgi:Protein of unknown function (DUF1176)